MDQLRALKEIFDGGFISSDEYEKRKKQLIDTITGTSLGDFQNGAKETRNRTKTSRVVTRNFNKRLLSETAERPTKVRKLNETESVEENKCLICGITWNEVTHLHSGHVGLNLELGFVLDD
jgi:hypothetical protein